MDKDDTALDLVTKGSNRLCAVSSVHFGVSPSLVAAVAGSSQLSVPVDFALVSPIVICFHWCFSVVSLMKCYCLMLLRAFVFAFPL